MAHFLSKKYKTKISDTDYDIISLGRKTTLGKKEKTEFFYDEKLKLMKNDPKKHIKIIALYWDYLERHYDNEEQLKIYC